MKVNIKTVMQYIFILLIFYLNDSFLYLKVLRRFDSVLLVFLILLMVFRKSLFDKRNVIFIGALLCFVLIVRLLFGGIGLSAWSTWAVMILTTTIAIRYSPVNFLNRFGKTVSTIAFCSLCCWIFALLFPSVYRSLTLFSSQEFEQITHWYTASNYVTTSYNEYGVLFYALRDYESSRNNGPFGEPGLYQMILNTTYFMLLFFKDHFNYSEKEYKRYLSVILISIITTQSTSGLLSFGVISLAYVLSKNDSASYKMKNRILLMTLLALIGLSLDYFMRGNNSILYKSVIKKLFNNGSLALDADTGYYRVVTVLGCLQALIAHPFGLGYDNLVIYLSSIIRDEYVGAQIIVTFAALGIIPMLVILIWLLSPVCNKKNGFWMWGSFVFMFINSALAQSKDFYPALILIPIYMAIIHNKNMEKEIYNSECY